MLSDIVRNTQASARALARAAAWNRAAIYAERDADAAMRRGDAEGEARHLAEMQRALRLCDQNMKRHDTLRATLGT